MALSCSRDPFCCFPTSQDMATFFDCHRQAFAYFGGVPVSIVHDRTKTVVRLPTWPASTRTRARNPLRFGSTAQPGCRSGTDTGVSASYRAASMSPAIPSHGQQARHHQEVGLPRMARVPLNCPSSVMR
ncbi:hypothetical protein [Streptomyces bottropensis]